MVIAQFTIYPYIKGLNIMYFFAVTPPMQLIHFLKILFFKKDQVDRPVVNLFCTTDV